VSGKNKKMKKTRMLYWTIAGLFAAGILSSVMPKILNVSEDKTILSNRGYPAHIIPLLGIVASTTCVWASKWP
jgi:hypothetical protein